METNLENSKDQSAGKPKLVVEPVVIEPITVGKAKPKDEQDEELDLELDLDNNDEDGEPDEESIADDETESDDDEEESEPEQPKKLSKEQRKILALKNEAKKLQTEKADLVKQLGDKKDTNKEEEIAKQYIDEGEDETTARRKAKSDIRQTNLEKQVEILLFEKTNRKVLAKYPKSDDDLEKIIKATNNSGMTVEQVCRGLYGLEMTAKEKRAVDALTDEGTVQVNTTVSKSIRSAGTPAKVKLTQEQLEIKRYLERKFRKTISDEDAIKYSGN
jgi:hypothetical protein